MSMYDLNTANKLMLLQGISLIEDGLRFLEWMSGYASENSFDTLTILRNRFEVFRECALGDGKNDYLFIDRANESLNNVEHCYKQKQKITTELENLRLLVVKEINEEEITEKQN